MDIVIRKNIPQYLDRLRAWLDETRDVKLENMADFFAARLDVYEKHMFVWSEAEMSGCFFKVASSSKPVPQPRSSKVLLSKGISSDNF